MEPKIRPVLALRRQSKRRTIKDEAAKAKALALAADDFFTHPVQPDELLAQIRELIGERQGPRAVAPAPSAIT